MARCPMSDRYDLDDTNTSNAWGLGAPDPLTIESSGDSIGPYSFPASSTYRTLRDWGIARMCGSDQ